MGLAKDERGEVRASLRLGTDGSRIAGLSMSRYMSPTD